MIDDANLPAPDPRALVEELRQLLGLRSRQSLRDRTFPELFTLLADEDRATPDRRFAALTRLLDDAIAAIDDPAHRHAAAALVGSGPGRWRTVTQRGTDAASAFGCGWDAYRRKRASGTSQLDDTLDAGEVAAAYEGMLPLDDMLRQSGQYGPRVDVPDDAPLQDKLMAFVGRQP